jgi:hypothetical protein
MKKLLIAFLLFISFKSNSQLIIAPAGNAAPAGNYPAIFDIHLKGGYRAVKDTFERNSIPLSFRKNMMLVGDTTSRKVWLFDSLRNSWSEFGGSSFNPSANQTITASYWDFTNYVHIGDNHSSGFWNNDLITVIGNWSNDGTNLTVDADNGLIQSWGNFQVWGVVGENDYATANAQINSDGTASFAGNSFRIENDGSVSGGYGSDIWHIDGSDGRALFATGKSQFYGDGGGYLANYNIYWDANGNISNDNNGAWNINADGAASFKSISTNYLDESNYQRDYYLGSGVVLGDVNNNEGDITSWAFGVDGLSYSHTTDGGDTYVSSWGINANGTASFAGGLISIDGSGNFKSGNDIYYTQLSYGSAYGYNDDIGRYAWHINDVGNFSANTIGVYDAPNDAYSTISGDDNMMNFKSSSGDMMLHLEYGYGLSINNMVDIRTNSVSSPIAIDLPNASGTMALTSDLTAIQPYRKYVALLNFGISGIPDVTTLEDNIGITASRDGYNFFFTKSGGLDPAKTFIVGPQKQSDDDAEFYTTNSDGVGNANVFTLSNPVSYYYPVEIRVYP